MSKKIECCKIHLLPGALDRARRALGLTGKAAIDFTGPDFQDVAAAYPQPAAFCVETREGERYFYPIHSVARVKVYQKEVLA